MESHKTKLCDQAELHYLSLALGAEYGDIPETTVSHVHSCHHCQQQIKALKHHLNAENASQQPTSPSRTPQSIHMLGQHLRYADRQVTCRIVSSRLGTLLQSEARLLAPTPITDHIGHCQPCKDDLSWIRSLDLNDNQLEHLDTLHESRTTGEPVTCSVAADSIRPFVRLEFQSIPSAVFQHLSHCQVCQLLIDQARTQMITDAGTSSKDTAPCRTVSSGKLFDLAFPLETAMTTDTGLTAHIRQCAHCLTKLQSFNRKINLIRQRPESNVVTFYDRDNATLVKSSPTPAYGSGAENPGSTRPAQPDHVRIGLGRVARMAVAAAAALIIALFVYHTPTASATSFEAMAAAFRDALNLHIERYVPKTDGPIEEKWISKRAGLYLSKIGPKRVIVNTPKGVITTRTSDNDPFSERKMGETDRVAYQQKKGGLTNIVPYESSADFPPGAQWRPLDDAFHERTQSIVQVYELYWETVLYNGQTVYERWQYFVEPGTWLPLRAEAYQSLPGSLERENVMIFEIGYTTEKVVLDEYSAWLRLP